MFPQTAEEGRFLYTMGFVIVGKASRAVDFSGFILGLPNSVERTCSPTVSTISKKILLVSTFCTIKAVKVCRQFP